MTTLQPNVCLALIAVLDGSIQKTFCSPYSVNLLVYISIVLELHMKTQGLELGIYNVFLSCLSIICRQITVLVSIPIVSY